MKFTLSTLRHRLLLLAFAAILALSAAYAPTVLDSVAGTNLTPAAFACTPPGGGC
ncbi:MAG: hypothetical protein KF832_07065 [Caldilineaceae bacterium]|nr:hypothetical protein [Caldilineaceae bacterium]